MILLAPFTKHDWYSLAGASRFSDNSEPLVNYKVPVDKEVSEKPLVMVVDGAGINLFLSDDPETGIYADANVFASESAMIAEAYKLLSQPITKQALRNAGFIGQGIDILETLPERCRVTGHVMVEVHFSCTVDGSKDQARNSVIEAWNNGSNPALVDIIMDSLSDSCVEIDIPDDAEIIIDDVDEM